MCRVILTAHDDPDKISRSPITGSQKSSTVYLKWVTTENTALLTLPLATMTLAKQTTGAFVHLILQKNFRNFIFGLQKINFHHAAVT